MEETTTTRKIDKNTIEITKTKTEVEVSTYILDDLYDQVKKTEQEIQDFIDLKNREIEKLKKVISEAEALEVSPVDETKKPAK